jgi:hypothetical protein
MRLHSIALLLVVAVVGKLPAQDSHPEFSRPLRVIDSIPAPESVTIGPDRAWYVSSFGKFGVKGDGAVIRIDPEKGTRELFATGLDDPCGLVFAGGTLWVADRSGVYRVSRERSNESSRRSSSLVRCTSSTILRLTPAGSST